MNKSLTVTTLIQVTCPVCKVSRQHDTRAVNGMSDRAVAKIALGDEAREWVQADNIFLHKACLIDVAEPPNPQCGCGRDDCDICHDIP